MEINSINLRIADTPAAREKYAAVLKLPKEPA